LEESLRRKGQLKSSSCPDLQSNKDSGSAIAKQHELVKLPPRPTPAPNKKVTRREGKCQKLEEEALFFLGIFRPPADFNSNTCNGMRIFELMITGSN